MTSGFSVPRALPPVEPLYTRAEAEDRDLFWYAETASDIFESFCAWHDKAGTPLFAGLQR